jgi:acetylornithine deacetylase
MPGLEESIRAAVDSLRDDIVETLSQAVRIRSVNPKYPGERAEDWIGGESRVSRLLASVYEAAGCEVDIFAIAKDRENCVGVLPGTGRGRSLLFNGHVDVVPGGPESDWADGDPWSGKVDSNRIHGRGSSDMKGGLVAQAFAAVALKRAGVRLKGDLILEAVVGEETMDHTLGTSACVERGYRADGAVVAEPSAPPAPLGLVVATPGVMRFVVTVIGRQGHPGMRGSSIHPGGGGWEVGVNAIDKAWLIYQAIRLREEEWGITKKHDLFTPGQFGIQVGVFVGSPHGRLDPFFIPDVATLDCIVIYHPDDQPEQVRREIEELLHNAASLDGWLAQNPPSVDWKHHWPPSTLAPDHALVGAAASAFEQAAGRPARVVGWTAVHDGSFLNAAGIPTICCGPGDVRAAHRPDESVDIDELILATKIYAFLAAGWCGVTNAEPGSLS